MEFRNEIFDKEKGGTGPVRIEMPYEAEWIIDNIRSHGYEAFIVGGCVRDAVLGRIPGDWDITTSAKPEQVKEILEARDRSKAGPTAVAKGLTLVEIRYE